MGTLRAIFAHTNNYSAMAPKLNIIVAVAQNQGIGKAGELPWRLKEEMKYFSRMTKAKENSSKQNVVLMGRKTWESIPAKFRPLPQRLNVVISSQAKSCPEKFEGSEAVCSFEEAIESVQSREELETVWVIGGSSVYQSALICDLPHRVYLTRVLKDFDCDTFMPKLDDAKFTTVTDPAVSTDIQTEGDIQYNYDIYEKI